VVKINIDRFTTKTVKRRQLYKISVFLSVIGLTLMYGSSIYLEPGEVDINQINKSQTGEVVEIKGSAVNVSKSSGNLFMDLTDSTGSIMVVDFDSESSVSEGDSISVIGNVELYEGKLEIISREIKKN